ncbi:MAG: hypothetical protein JO228_13305, partial [Xanthobacteraceae bacterium]|nr:hypothetical protein [Xanthobacteraceae bacterium]
MRYLVSRLTLTLLALGMISIAPAQAQCPANIPSKTIIITNDTPTTLYPIIHTGKRPVDDWLRAQCVATSFSLTYPSDIYLYKIYVNGVDGIAPGKSVSIKVPFYSQLVQSPTGTQDLEFIDWWNGGRILLMDQADQVRIAYAADQAYTDPMRPTLKNPVSPLTPGPCVVNGSDCTQQSIFRNSALPPPSDRSQLLEFTFGDAITAGGILPYPMKLTGV